MLTSENVNNYVTMNPPIVKGYLSVSQLLTLFSIFCFMSSFREICSTIWRRNYVRLGHCVNQVMPRRCVILVAVIGVFFA